MKKQQSGFTLVELIMVIVVLGILAAFALPRFADFGGDARRASIQGVEASMKSASAIARSAFLAAGNNPTAVSMEGTDNVAIADGYASAAGIVVAANITGGATATATGDFIVTTNAGVTTVQAKGAATAANCQVIYTDATAAADGVPTIVATVTDC